MPVVRATQIQGDAGGGWQVLPAPKEVMVLKRQFRGLRPVEVLVDSGAAESVIPTGLLQDYPVQQGSAALSGEKYMTADGKEIPNRGEQAVKFYTQEQHRCVLTFQVTDATKTLLSVAQLAATGHAV
eukprot:2826712-Lingulodinium_polyedra.AAC.1